jgi:uncharacterized membrane protein YfcA
MSTGTLLLATAALTLAGFVQGLTGFGFGMTAMALLPFVLGVVEAQAVVTLTSTASCLLMAAVTVRHVRWSDVWRLWLGTVTGVPLGFLFLESLPRPLMTRVLGLVLCMMVLFEFTLARRSRLRWPPWLAMIIGLSSGILTGAFNVGGPPLVAYLYSQPWSKEEHVASLTAVFLSGGLIRVAMLLSYNELSPEIWTSAGWAVVPMLAAILCGNSLLVRVPEKKLRAGVFTVLLFLGGRYLFAT